MRFPHRLFSSVAAGFRLLVLILVALATTLSVSDLRAESIAATPKRPKLILALLIDQFRYDYLLRFRSEYSAGLKRLMDEGAVFHDAHHIAFPTVTAVGHSTFLSGATPSQSGIVGNEWYDRALKKQVTSVTDFDSKLVGGTPGGTGSSPKRMLVSTVGDEIKMSGQNSKVIGISIKDRGAVLPAGHMADAAYWFDAALNQWTTSTYYMNRLPAWVEAVNTAKPAKRAENQTWYALGAQKGKGGEAPATLCPTCNSLEASPWGNEIIEDFAEKALLEEKMGQHPGTDLLSVSFSSNDYVGHAVGPDDPAVRDMALRTDQLIGKLLAQVDRSVGLGNVVVVLTADHGVSPVPELNAARKMPGGRANDASVAKAINDALNARYGEGKWLQTASGTAPYFNLELVEEKKLRLVDVENTAAEAIRKLPVIYRVYTKDQIAKGEMPRDRVSEMVTNGSFPERNADLVVIQQPYYLFGRETRGTSHGTPFNYDSHVPVIFMGIGVKPGHYYSRIATNDIAPTLSALAGVLEPSGSVGRVLAEILR